MSTDSTDGSSLDDEDVHHVLSNSRRREAIERLRENGGVAETAELAERIAALESGQSPPPRSTRQSVYVSLHQTHLPKLDDLDIVDYDGESKTATLRDEIDEVAVYMETVPEYGISWGELYVGLGLLGALLVAGADIGVPGLSELPPHYWAYLAFGLVVVAGAYRTNQQGESVLSRLRS